jgi:hypothetical protein
MEVVKVVSRLAHTADSEISSMLELRQGYWRFLRRYQGDDSVPPDGAPQHCFDLQRIQHLVTKYTDTCELTDLGTEILATPLSAMQEAMAAITEGQNVLNEVNPLLREVFDVVIHTLFYARSPESGGGSVSSAIGVIWCGNRRHWSTQDIAEFLVHEFTHNVVFLDELCNQHYCDLRDIAQQENYAFSTILRRLRPLDKAFHSLVVGYEVLRWRQEADEPPHPIVHPSSKQLRQGCLETIQSIRTVMMRRHLVTERFHAVVERIADDLRSL